MIEIPDPSNRPAFVNARNIARVNGITKNGSRTTRVVTNAATGQQDSVATTTRSTKQILIDALLGDQYARAAIKSGIVPGARIIHKSGHQPIAANIAAASITPPQNFWGDPANLCVRNTYNPQGMQVASNSASEVANTPIVIEGLDTSGYYQAEVVYIDGNTPTNSGLTWLIVNQAIVGYNEKVTPSNLGVITCNIDSFVQLRIPAGAGKDTTLCYTVPKGRTAYLLDLELTSGGGGSVLYNMQFQLFVNQLEFKIGGAELVVAPRRLVDQFTSRAFNPVVQRRYNGAIVLPELHQLEPRISAIDDTASPFTASGHFILLEVENDYFGAPFPTGYEQFGIKDPFDDGPPA
jgi:hypothetical protein